MGSKRGRGEARADVAEPVDEARLRTERADAEEATERTEPTGEGSRLRDARALNPSRDLKATIPKK